MIYVEDGDGQLIGVDCLGVRGKGRPCLSRMMRSGMSEDELCSGLVRISTG